jgi:flagellar basal body rod protein FlgG
MFFQWFNLEDPDGNQVLVRTASFRVKQQMQKTKANGSKK